MSVPAFAALLLASVPVDANAVPPVVGGPLAIAPASNEELTRPADAAAATAEPPVPVELVAADMPPVAEVMDSDSDQRDQNVIVVTARSHVPGDPLQGVNIKSFEVTQAVDRALVRPVALTYQRIVPDPLRSGFRNFLNNLREPVAFLNFLLQIKPGKAAETAGRFAINSTIGAAGLFDFARRRPFKLPRRPNGFANTLGYYGVKPGPFLYLPLIGPTTLRDFLGDGLDRLFLPVVVGRPFSRPVYAISVGTLSSLDQRAEFDEKLQVLHADSVDPYAATRQDYLHHRQDVIDALHGRPAPDRSDADVAPPALPVPAVPLPQH